MSVHRTYSAILSMSIIACGTDPASPTPGAGVSPFTLALVGSDDLTLHPDEARLLHVVLTQDDAGPVPDGRIHFELRDGDAGGALIDAADVITDEDGIARVTFTAGPRPVPVPFHLAASTPDLGAAPVAFTIAVIPERRLLEIVPSAATRVSDDGRRATTLAGVSASVALRVRELDADTFEPIAGDRITFTLPPVASSRWSATSSRIATASTGMGGEARVYLITSQAAEGPWQVVAQGAGGDASVMFEVRVQGQLCPIDSDGCGEDEPVPECDPAAPACGSSTCRSGPSRPSTSPTTSSPSSPICAARERCGSRATATPPTSRARRCGEAWCSTGCRCATETFPAIPPSRPSARASTSSPAIRTAPARPRSARGRCCPRSGCRSPRLRERS